MRSCARIINYNNNMHYNYTIIPDSVVSSTGEMKDLSVTTLSTVDLSEIKQSIIQMNNIIQK